MRYLLPLVLCGPAAAADLDPALVNAASAPLSAVQSHTLPNGLRVYLLPVPSAPVVTTMVAYKVGACDEAKDQTGLSHYLEHLMFKGTAKLKPGDIDRLTQTQRRAQQRLHLRGHDRLPLRLRGRPLAASPSNIEADRMRGNLRIDPEHEFEQEKGAVIAELKEGGGLAVGPRTQNGAADALYGPKADPYWLPDHRRARARPSPPPPSVIKAGTTTAGITRTMPCS